MRPLITIVLLVLLLPVLVIVGIAAGPAALVAVFIAGWALLVAGVIRMGRGARRRRAGHFPS